MKLTNYLKKALSFTVVAFTATVSAVALPGISQTVPDLPGQYVYYKDSTFARESYLGVIYYDDSTYAFRYVAPQVNNKKNPLPKLEMQVYLTIDPTKSTLEFTGERVEPFPKCQEETDIINYIHDFAYEMTARRQKAGNISELKEVSQDYAQFGGYVKLQYNPLIPVFNLSKITAADGKPVFTIVTAGQLSSSSDTSFVDFEGIPDKVSSKTHVFKSSKKLKSETITVENSDSSFQEFILDSQWKQQPGINMWTLNTVANLSTVSLAIDDEKKPVLLRLMLLGRNNSYPNWGLLDLDETSKDNISIKQVFYDSKSKAFTYNFKILKKMKNNTFGLFDLSVYAGTYLNNTKYFNEIIKSYKTK